jgi:hypothetical protein
MSSSGTTIKTRQCARPSGRCTSKKQDAPNTTSATEGGAIQAGGSTSTPGPRWRCCLCCSSQNTNVCSYKLQRMTRRVWFYWDSVNLRVTKTEGSVSASTKITVRPPDADQVPWGVWVNGERSPDTWVLVNGVLLTIAHATGVPVHCHSPIAKDWPVWDQHETRGGGQPITALL